MIIQHPEKPPKKVHDYDFTFTNSFMMSFSLDFEAGDTIDFGEPGLAKVYMSPKPSPTDSSVILPYEDTTIYMDKVITVQHREREIVPLNFEQELELKQDYARMLASASKPYKGTIQ